MASQRKIQLSGLDEELAQDIEQRISEFERKHEADLLKDGPGWVPKIRRIDYLVALALNGAITLWLIIALIR